MPPNKGINSKVAAATEKKAVVEARKSAVKAKHDEATEAAEWSKGADARSASKAAQAEAKAAEAAKKAADKARLLAEEEASLSAVKKVKPKAKGPGLKPWEAALENPGKKKTRFELEQEAERRKQAEAEALAKKETKGIVLVDDDIITMNTNRLNGEQWVSGVDDALQELGISGGPPGVDKHPEKKMKAAYKAYEEANLPVVREEKPGLKLSQYKQMIFKSWQSSPQNPMNQQVAATKDLDH